jgi:hypothetical protein
MHQSATQTSTYPPVLCAGAAGGVRERRGWIAEVLVFTRYSREFGLVQDIAHSMLQL